MAKNFINIFDEIKNSNVQIGADRDCALLPVIILCNSTSSYTTTNQNTILRKNPLGQLCAWITKAPSCLTPLKPSSIKHQPFNNYGRTEDHKKLTIYQATNTCRLFRTDYEVQELKIDDVINRPGTKADS
ncbi:hypothetical protein QTP88_002320 [Uroleucon formosanum]